MFSEMVFFSLFFKQCDQCEALSLTNTHFSSDRKDFRLLKDVNEVLLSLGSEAVWKLYGHFFPPGFSAVFFSFFNQSPLHHLCNLENEGKKKDAVLLWSSRHV